MSNHLDPYAIFGLFTNLLVVAECDSLQIVTANDAVLNLTGYSQDQLTQLTLTDLYPNLEDIDFCSSLATQTPNPSNSNLIGADGFQCAVNVQLSVKLIQGISCVVCVADLVTDNHILARELQEQRTIYRALITGIFDLFFRIRRDGTYIDFKIPSETGLYEPEYAGEIIGRNVTEIVPPDVTEAVMPVIERVIDTGKPGTVEYQILEDSGMHYYDACFAASLPDEIVAVVRDITDKKRTEAVLRQQRDLSAALSSSIGLKEALIRVLETAMSVSEMDCGGIYLVDQEQGGALRLINHGGLPDTFIEQISYYPPDAPQTQIIMRGESVFVDYLPHLPVPNKAVGLQEKLRAFAMIPIRHQQEILGCINVASHRFDIDAMHETARNALETIAFHSGNAIVRMRTQEKLRESEELARTLLNAPSDSAILSDRQGKILAINEAGAHRFNATIDTLIGTNVTDFLPPEVGERRLNYGQQVFRSKAPVTFDDERAGIHFSTTLYPLFDAEGNVSRLAIFGRDVTLEKKAREVLQKRENLLEAVAQASNCLLAVDDLAVAIDEALGIVGRAAQTDNAYIFKNHIHPESGKPATSLCYLWSNSPDEETQYDDMQNQEWHVKELTAWYNTLRAGDSVVGPSSCFSKSGQDLLASFGIKSFLLVPILMDQGDFWGFMGFDDQHTEREWLPEELSVLRLMAASVGAAIKRQQVEENLRREREIADTLREVGMVLTSTLDLEEVLARILEQAKRVVPYDAANIMLIEDRVARVEVGTGYEKIGPNGTEVKGITFQLDQTPILQTIVDTATPYVCPNVDNDDRWIYRSVTSWIKSWLGVPIVSREKVVGFFSLDSHVAEFYTTKHLNLIEPFAKQAAIAFENATLFAETQSLERIKSEMIRMASHDLRSPLGRIQHSITAVKQNGRQPFTNQHLEHCARIEEAIVDMERIISNILSVERIEAQYQIAKPINWCDLIEQSVATVRSDLAAKQHDLTVECETGLPVTRGDPVQVQQAIVNLLGNAIKFTPEGGSIMVRVFLKPYGLDHTVAVEIEDNGIGIPPEQQTDLFRPAYRAPHSRDIDGMGLGLSIVKTAVEYHQGSVYFRSQPGNGSLFGFRIPIQKKRWQT